MGTGNILGGGVTLQKVSLSSRGSSNTPRPTSYYGNRDKLWPFGTLACVHLYLPPFYFSNLLTFGFLALTLAARNILLIDFGLATGFFTFYNLEANNASMSD